MNEEISLKERIRQETEQFKSIVEDAAMEFTKNTGLAIKSIDFYKIEMSCGFEYSAGIDLRT